MFATLREIFLYLDKNLLICKFINMNALQKLEMQNYIVFKLPITALEDLEARRKQWPPSAGLAGERIEMPREELAAAQENFMLDAEGDIRDFEVDGFSFT